MDLIDVIIDRAKKLKSDGISVRSICASKGDESVEIFFENIRTADVYESDKEVPNDLEDERVLDLYHET